MSLRAAATWATLCFGCAQGLADLEPLRLLRRRLADGEDHWALYAWAGGLTLLAMLLCFGAFVGLYVRLRRRPRKDVCYMALIHGEGEARAEAQLACQQLRELLQEPEYQWMTQRYATALYVPEESAPLSEILRTIRRCDNVALLLTPETLSSAACLAELVAACQSNAHVIPVLVSRPGPMFTALAEESYRRLEAGRELEPQVREALAGHGVAEAEVGGFLRLALQKDPMIFTPRLSPAARSLELQELLQRSMQQTLRASTHHAAQLTGLCPAGHVLHPSKGTSGECTRCSRAISQEKPETVMSCELCHWWVCRSCSKESRAYSELRASCPRGHLLKVHKTPGGECRGCRASVKADTHVMNCAECQWWLCASCAAGQQDAPTVLSDAHAAVVDVHADEDGRPESEASSNEEPPPDVVLPKSRAQARGSVSAEAYGDWNRKSAFVAPVVPKSDEQRERLRACLGKSFLFAPLDLLDLDTVLSAMEEVPLGPNQRCIRQGDDGDCLYVVESGSLRCISTSCDGTETVLRTCRENDVFGELALLYNCPRAASVESETECRLWRLDRDTFNHIVKDAAQRKRERYEAFLARVPLLAAVDAYERSQLADALKARSHAAGETIVSAGDVGDEFFFVEEGSATASKGDELTVYGPGDWFGELALLSNSPRAATVRATSDVRLLCLDGRSFQRLSASGLREKLAHPCPAASAAPPEDHTNVAKLTEGRASARAKAASSDTFAACEMHI